MLNRRDRMFENGTAYSFINYALILNTTIKSS